MTSQANQWVTQIENGFERAELAANLAHECARRVYTNPTSVLAETQAWEAVARAECAIAEARIKLLAALR